MKRLIAAFALMALTAADATLPVIPAEHGLIEGIAWDARGQQLFAGSVEDGVLLVREDEAWRRVVLPYSTAGLFGMAVDARRRVLWLTSGIAGPTKNKKGFRGIIGVTTQGFEAAGKIPMPVDDARGQPGDLAIAPDGSVYVSDGTAGGLFVCKPGCKVLVPLVVAGTFKSTQGLAVSRDGLSLFVADYPTGLWRIDLKKPKKPVAIAASQSMKGIDGLVRDGDALIAIINGNGRKVLRLTLDATASNVTDVATLATPKGPGDPTLGVVAGEHLLYIGDAQWDRFDASGKAIAPARSTAIANVKLPPGPRPPEKKVRLPGERDF